MVKKIAPSEIYLKDYAPSNYLIENTFLHFDLHPAYTLVKSILKLYRNEQVKENNVLSLDGEELQLRAVLIDGKILAPHHYEVSAKKLIIPNVPDAFTLETEVLIKPADNKALSGLYPSRENYCTQCEPHGFRRITYFLDRPDVLTRFTTAISAEKHRYPVLLSNGNLVDAKELDANRHWVMWEDPFLKSSYLFALVAGDYEWREDVFKTLSGRTVVLRVYVERGNLAQSDYAMESLKRAMHWDEKVYGREYDLDMYMIVAVSDFNMGAMENKGLNIFNDRYILAESDTATDDDYVNVESVIGHEYFHNWSGNRVTVRDWFQITLKEGLTIFRDQNFTADMTSHPLKRIKDVTAIRNLQFLQDAGPMAHPIRPDSYIEVNNFYTVTVYNKGAEVIRMLETILGKHKFRKAMDLYFERNDGKAVTTEDFIKAMEDTSMLDLTQFRRWYSQAGTPYVQVSGHYDEAEKTCTLHFKQACPPTPGQPHKENFYIPIRMALLNSKGEALPLRLAAEDAEFSKTVRVILLTETEETLVFQGITEKPLPSLLRNFSAPVKLHYPYADDELIFLMSRDTDGFNAWDSGQQLLCKLIRHGVEKYASDQRVSISDNFTEALRAILNNDKLDKLLIAEMLTFPSESYLLELMHNVDITLIYEVRKALRQYLAEVLEEDFLRIYNENVSSAFSLNKIAMGQRRIKNLSLAYLMLLKKQKIIDIAMDQFQQANNLTDRMGALMALTNIDCEERQKAFQQFYDNWQKEPLVIDKWFSLQALSTLPHTFERVKSLMSHPRFNLKNPNRVRALISVFSHYNYPAFHNKSGEPYAFLADLILTIDTFNPQLAARLIEPLVHWRKYDKYRQTLMREQLERIANVSLSNDVAEIVFKSLAPI
jgi:aminopeptidase N